MVGVARWCLVCDTDRYPRPGIGLDQEITDADTTPIRTHRRAMETSLITHAARETRRQWNDQRKALDGLIYQAGLVVNGTHCYKSWRLPICPSHHATRLYPHLVPKITTVAHFEIVFKYMRKCQAIDVRGVCTAQWAHLPFHLEMAITGLWE